MNTYLFRLYKTIKRLTPEYVKATILKLIPLVFVSSIFDVFGLVIIFPVIKIILDSSIIYESKILFVLYNSYDFESEMQFAVVLLAFIVMFFIIKNIIVYVISVKQAKLAFKVATNLAIDQFERFILKPYRFHTDYKTGDLLRSIIEIPYNFVNGILLSFVVIINELIVAIIISIAIIIYNPMLFLSVFIFITPIFVLYTYIQRKNLRHVSRQRDDNHTAMFARGRQGLEGFREIILFNKIDYFISKFAKSVQNFSEAFGKVYLYNAFSPRVIEAIAVASIFFIFIGGVALNYSVSTVASFLGTFALAAYRLIPSVNKVILSYNNIKSSEFVFDHFEKNSIKKNTSPPFKRGNSETVSPLKFNQQIEFKNISFCFSDSDGKVINDVSLSIKKGETIGIIGESGSGKTTLLNVLLMLLEQNSGSIEVDGVRLTNELKDRWYKTLSYVPQNVIIISGSIMENITFGIAEEEVDYEKLHEVIEKSQLRDLIDNLPLGLRTKVGSSGLNISGGQRQRIGIARALYHKGSILVFDEATSSLDKDTEQLLTESIKTLSDQKYTIIIVAHRLETLKYCDRIYKIEKGKVGMPMKYSQVI